MRVMKNTEMKTQPKDDEDNEMEEDTAMKGNYE